MKGLRSPHLLLASANDLKMINNLNHLLEVTELQKLTSELHRNVVELYNLGIAHYTFAADLRDEDWRQKISRLYYAVYNVRRALMLKHNGSFSTDASDHQKIDDLPEQLKNRESHITNLRTLREDRNLADYSHLARVEDLIIKPNDAKVFASSFIENCKEYLTMNGLSF